MKDGWVDWIAPTLRTVVISAVVSYFLSRFRAR
jgi:hypothetical protein